MISVNFTHLRLLFMKNMWLQLRSPIWLFLEMLLPAALVLLYSFTKQHTVVSMDQPFDYKDVKFHLPSQMANESVAFTFKENCCDRESIDWFNETIHGYFKAKEFKNFEKMKKSLVTSEDEDSSFAAGFEIEEMDRRKNILKYKLLVDAEVVQRETTDYSWGDVVKIYKRKNTNGETYKVQFILENIFVLNANKSELNEVAIALLPNGNIIRPEFFLEVFYSIMPAMIILAVVANTRNIVVERQTIQPYLSVMGVTKTTFYLSHCLVLLIKVNVSVIALGISAFAGFPDFPWVIAIATFISFSFAATAFSAMISAFFSSPSTAMQLCISGWLSMVITPHVYPPDKSWGTPMATVTSLWPTYALHFITKYMIACSDRGEELNCFTGIVDSKWTNQAALYPFLILILDSVLMTGIAAIMESGVMRRIFCFFKKKIRRGKAKAAPQVEKLSDADESFEMDEAKVDISLENVFKEYETGEKAVNGLNMKAHRGQVTVLLGHNGAGKTTTFSMIAGVEKATSGMVEICGHKAGSLESRSVIGYCAQANTLIDDMTVKDHLWLLHGLKKGQGKYWDEGKELVSQLGLEGHVNSKVKNLSGGQKRKLCMCMALIGGSQVILLDEPTAGMDPESRRDVEMMLEEVKKDKTVMLTTHYMDEAETLGDRIFIVAAGQTVCSGSPQFLKKRFGTGYVLTLVADESCDSTEFAKELTSVVNEFAPSAKLGEIRGKQVEIAIPVKEQKSFPDLFERLETDQRALGVCSFGLSLNSLEQVFLRVTNLTDDKATITREIPLEDALNSLYQEERRTGCSLYFSQLRAVLVKKGIFSLRFWSQLVTQIGLPLSSIVVGLVYYTLADPPITHFPISHCEKGASVVMMNFSHSANSENFLGLLRKKVKTADEGMFMNQFVRKHHEEKIYFGLIFDDPTMRKTEGYAEGARGDVLLLPNVHYPLSYASAINALNNARLNSTGSISVAYETYSSVDSVFSTNLALLAILVLTIMMCQFIVTTVEDRISSFAHQQLLMGLSPFIYWAGDFLYGLFLYCAMNVIYIFSAMFTGIVSPLMIIAMFFLLILYYWAVIPSVFILSRVCGSSSRAALIHWILLFASFGFMILVPPLLTDKLGFEIDVTQWNILKFNGWEWANLILALLFPTGPMFRLVVVFIKLCNDQAPQGQRMDLIGQLIFHSICLFVTGAASLCFFLLMQERHIRYMVSLVAQIKRARKYVAEEKISMALTETHTTEGEAMLVAEDLCKVYGKNCALAHLNMEVRERECFGLLGVSGAGKTTAFNIITGQMFATQGKAIVDGTDCKRNLILGFCPQFDAIHKDFTGREALTILARIHGYRNPRQIADDVIEIVGMQAHAKKRMYRCSGGQRRRISVAASLLPRNSRIIILDEATAGIDPKARRDIWEVLAAVREHSAILMTSHSMDECEALCSRIGILKHGGLAAVGTSQTLKSRYGNFFTLTMALPSSKMRAAVAAAVAEWFPGSILKSDGFSLHLKWQVPKKPDDCWSSVFSSCIELSEKIGVPDFCLTQSTLQDIFLLLAGEGKMSKMADSTTKSQKSSISSTKSD